MSARLLVVNAGPEVQAALGPLEQRLAAGFRHAGNAREALDMARAATPDLVVAEEGRFGADTLRLLRSLRALSPETRVILTGAANPARVAGAMRARAYSYFHTPAPRAPLAEMAEQALAARDWLDDIRVLDASPVWVSFLVRCKFAAAERATQFVRELEADLPARVTEDVAAAFRELLLNAVEHGAAADPRKKVRISLVRAAGALTAYFHDPGRGFNFNSLPHAAISNPDGAPFRHAEVRQMRGQRAGGFGILIARKLVDDLVYSERGNEVMFVKRFN